MKKLLIVFSSFFVLLAQGAIPSKSVYEQLTGTKKMQKNQINTMSEKRLVPAKIIASAQKALLLARQSRQEKNYILAIKRFNFILKYYGRTQEAKLALTEKASLYQEMGLTEQAAYNQKKVSQFNKIMKKSSAGLNSQTKNQTK